MSELRNELQRARETYAAARYPGDLAMETLPAPRRRALRWFAAASAIAAAIIVSWSVWRDAPNRENRVPINAAAVIAPTSLTLTLEMPPMPPLPSDMSFTIPPMPQIPSLDALRRANETNSTTQEAV